MKRNGKIIDKYGSVCYYKDDKLHREDGPAVEYADGAKAWYLNSIRYSEKDYIVEVRKIKLQRIKELLK